MLQSMGSQKVGYDLATEQQQHFFKKKKKKKLHMDITRWSTLKSD